MLVLWCLQFDFGNLVEWVTSGWSDSSVPYLALHLTLISGCLNSLVVLIFCVCVIYYFLSHELGSMGRKVPLARRWDQDHPACVTPWEAGPVWFLCGLLPPYISSRVREEVQGLCLAKISLWFHYFLMQKEFHNVRSRHFLGHRGGCWRSSGPSYRLLNDH